MKEQTKILRAISTVIESVQEGQNFKQCPQFHPDCGNCRAHQLLGLLAWYDSLIDEGI